MSVEKEEGTKPVLDFAKVRLVAATEQSVVPVVLQHADTLQVLFVAYVNELALQTTLQEGTAVLWSTSRNELWRKGATSGDILDLVDVRVNCEQNSLLYLVRPQGAGVCHTAGADGTTRDTCFYRSVTAPDALSFLDDLR